MYILSCVVHHIACTVQSKGCTGTSVYICTCEVVEYCASENVTPGIAGQGDMFPSLVEKKIGAKGNFIYFMFVDPSSIQFLDPLL